MNFFKESFICLCISYGTISTAQEAYPAQNIEMVNEIVDVYAKTFEFSGNVLIGQGDSIIYGRSNGFANHEHRVLNTFETKFRLASLSKQFTATALLILEQQGKVDFNEPISTYLDDLTPEIGDKVTVHQMLSHSSGLTRDIESLSDEELGQSSISLSDLIQLINTSELQFEPGQKWSYSNLGYTLAAAIIEEVMGASYGESLEILIFKPLNMKNTGHEQRSDSVTNLASGYVQLPSGIVNAAYEDKSYVIGAGSIYSTTNDLFIWTRELMSGSLLNDEIREKLFSKQAGRYSYGWFIDTYVWPPVNDANQAVNPHHEGGSPGFESKISLLVDHDIMVIILSNKLPSNLGRLANQITNVCLGFEEEIPRPDGSFELYHVLFNQGVEATVSLISSWEDAGKKYLIPDRTNIYLVGRGYMDSQDYEKAHLVMDLLIRLKPKWSYPYLFKAIMLENKGEIKNAADLYQKVLEIDPKQSNAINRLNRLSRTSPEIELNHSFLPQGAYLKLLMGFALLSIIVILLVAARRAKKFKRRT